MFVIIFILGSQGLYLSSELKSFISKQVMCNLGRGSDILKGSRLLIICTKFILFLSGTFPDSLCSLGRIMPPKPLQSIIWFGGGGTEGKRDFCFHNKYHTSKPVCDLGFICEHYFYQIMYELMYSDHSTKLNNQTRELKVFFFSFLQAVKMEFRFSLSPWPSSHRHVNYFLRSFWNF